MTRNGFGFGFGQQSGRGMGGRGNGQCLGDGTGFGSRRGQGRRRCRFEQGDGRWGFAARDVIGTHPFASAIARMEAAIEGIKRQIADLGRKP